MASAELQKLWDLHRIDAAIQVVRQRAAHLDVGQTITAEIQAIESEEAEVLGRARALSAELTDLELANRTLDDKLKKFDKELYGGKVVNPREIANINKEIAILKKQRGDHDNRILELWDELPAAKEAAAAGEARLEEAKVRLAARQKAAAAEKAALEAEFKRLVAARPAALVGISPTLLARYDDLRKKHNGTGMAQVTREQSCSGCGTMLPERTIQALKEDKVMVCETCRRLLHFSEGIV